MATTHHRRKSSGEAVDAALIRIAICGGPKTGKTTLSATLPGKVMHTDDAAGLGWSAASLEVSKWFDRPGPFVIEGVAVARALRKWLLANPEGKPCDKLIWLANAWIPTTPGQQRMATGCRTVLAAIMDELKGRGVAMECPVDPPASSRAAPFVSRLRRRPLLSEGQAPA